MVAPAASQSFHVLHSGGHSHELYCCREVMWALCDVLQSIQDRANHKEHMLSLVNAERKAANDRKRIERDLFDSLRRDKVDSIQKQQVS